MGRIGSCREAEEEVQAGKAALGRELGRLVGSEHVTWPVDDSSPYNRDMSGEWQGVVGHADAVVRPASGEEVQRVVSFCYERGIPIVPRGGGTGVTGGATPLEGGVVCSVERLVAIHELEPALWRMHVGAGLNTAHVRRLARESGLFFAPDPGASEQSQIGGNVATNAGGPHAFKYGPTGSWVSGLEAVLAPGELVQVGGPFRRDVTGYDLKSLLVGSEGTLGVITAVRLRLLPAPQSALALVSFHASTGQGCGAILSVLGSGVVPSVLDFLDGDVLEIVRASYPGEVPVDARFALLVELDGTTAEARVARAELADVLGEGALVVDVHDDVEPIWRWRDGVSGSVSGVLGGKVSEDVVVPVEHLEHALARLERLGEMHRLRSCAWGHGGDGNIHATVLVDKDSPEDLRKAQALGEELFSMCVELGGSISGEHGIGWIKRGQLAKQWSGRALTAHEEIKRALDPKGLFNPGKKLGRAASLRPGR
jgi:glycolate oxidase subunit GlcD